MEVKKIDAAKNQIEEAIMLFFEKRDPISIHTLTAAAGEILHNLTSKKVSIFRSGKLIRAEKQEE